MKRKGITRIELFVVIATIALFMVIIIVLVPPRARLLSYRIGCGSNLKGIGRAMLQYSQDNDGNFPVAGGPYTGWRSGGSVSSVGWRKEWSKPHRWGRPPRNTATITSCFYLLVKYGMAEPKQFICKGDEATLYVEPSSISNGWDFGDGLKISPGECVSYSYHMPFSFRDPREGHEGEVRNFAINQRSADESPMCADRNPFLDMHLAGSEPDIDDNCYAHGGRGQNVLYKDMHVAFEKSPLVGIGEDNIWCYYDSGDQPPQFVGDDGPPSNSCDAYLVSEYQRMMPW